jgi:hypothetical protein
VLRGTQYGRVVIEWAAIVWKVAPIAKYQIKRWWRRDTARTLNGLVVKDLEAPDLPVGIQGELVRQWKDVRGDPILTRLVASLLAHPDRDDEALVPERLRELLDDLDLKLGIDDTVARLTRAVLGNLVAAQPDAQAAVQADSRRTHSKLDALGAELGRLTDQQPLPDTRPMPSVAAQVALILPGDLVAHQERVLARLRDRDAATAGRLAALLQSQGAAALDGLVAVPPAWAEGAPPQLWAAVNRLANAAGRFRVARAAALREAEDPAADRGAALVRAARSAYYENDVAAVTALVEDVLALGDENDPALLLFESERAPTHVERLALAERVEPRDDDQRAAQLAQQAFAHLGMGHAKEARELAVRSLEIDPHAGGQEAKHLAVVLAAADEFPHVAQGPEELSEAARWFLELAEENRQQGRGTLAGVAVSRAAIALAIGAGDPADARDLISASEAAGEIAEREAAWNFSLAASFLGDPERALQLMPTNGDNYARVQRAAVAVAADIDVEHAVAELDQLVDAPERDVAQGAAIARIAAAHNPAIDLPEALAERVEDGPRLLAHAKAARAAASGNLVAAQALLTDLDDPISLGLRADLAAQAGNMQRAVRLMERLVADTPDGLNRLRLADRRRDAGDLTGARVDALAAADDPVNTASLRREAYAMAAAAAADEGNMPALEEVATAWRRFDSSATDASWWRVYALARQQRHADALVQADADHLPIEREQQALLLAEIYAEGIADPVERLKRLSSLSDQQGRPEKLEHKLVIASLPFLDDLPEGPLVDRLQLTATDFRERFPDSTLMQSATFDPEDPIGSMFAELERLDPGRAARNVALAQSEARLRTGQAPLAEVASRAGLTTLKALVDGRPLPLAVTDPEVREQERRAAERAIDHAAAVWDATGIGVASGLPDGTGGSLRSILVGSHVNQATFDDVMRGEAVGNGRTDESRHGEAVKRAAAFVSSFQLESDTPGGPAGSHPQLADLLSNRKTAPPPMRALAGAINAARALELPLYSDDRAARALAREMGVEAFGTLALLETLEARGEWSPARVHKVVGELADYGSWGLELSPEELVDITRKRGFAWDAGSAGFFSDMLAQLCPPRGLVGHAAALLLAVAAESETQLATWTTNVLAAFRDALNKPAPVVAGALLPQVLDLGPDADRSLDPARATVVRAVRVALLHIGAWSPQDPLLAIVADWINAVSADPEQQAAVLATVLRQVDVADAELLRRTFIRED